MLKKITSSILSLIIIIISVQNNALAVSTTEKNKKTVDSQINEDNGINYSSYAGDLAPEYVYTVKDDPEYAMQRDYMSEKARFLPTLQLLDYFLESVVLPGYVYSQSIPNEMTHDDYSCHKEYVELTSRNDLITALEAYAQKLSEKSENEGFTQVAFERVLKQTEINRILTETFQPDILYPNLYNVYSNSQINRDNGINYSLSDAGAFDPEYVYTIQVTPGYYAVKRDYMSEKARFLPTLQLLDYFLESVVLPGYVYPQSIPNEMTHDDYSCHKEYVELISRNDLITALEAYAQKLSEKSENESFTQVAFERVLNQTEINRILTEIFQPDVLYPNLFDILKK